MFAPPKVANGQVVGGRTTPGRVIPGLNPQTTPPVLGNRTNGNRNGNGNGIGIGSGKMGQKGQTVRIHASVPTNGGDRGMNSGKAATRTTSSTGSRSIIHTATHRSNAWGTNGGGTQTRSGTFTISTGSSSRNGTTSSSSRSSEAGRSTASRESPPHTTVPTLGPWQGGKRFQSNGPPTSRPGARTFLHQPPPHRPNNLVPPTNTKNRLMQRRWTNNPSVYPTASFKAMKALELKPRPIIVRPQPIPFPGPSIGQPVVEVDFGVLGRDGSTYSSEYSVGVKGFLHVNRDGNYLSVSGDGQGFAPARSFRIVISFDAIAAIITPTSSTHPPSIIFELSYAPSLETYTTAARIVRISSFDDEHAFVAPYTTHHLRISLASTAAMHAFLKLVKNLPVPRTVYKDVTVEVGRLYAAEVLYDVRSTLATVNIEDAFQLEAILYDGVIAPVDIEEIVEHLRGYKEEGDMGDKESELVLVELRRMLLEERLARRERDTTPIVDLPLRSVRGSQDLDRTVLELLEAAITTVQDREWLGEQDDVNTFSCRHVSITPSTLILSGPYRESSNAIVRRYPQGSTHYLRVGFVEEDGTRLAVGRRGIDSEFIDRLVLTPLLGLLDLGGRYYEFLGYSQSSIRRHAGYFVAPFPRNVDDGKEGEGGEKEIKASDIRNGFGDLSKIADQPTMYGARLSLGFTSSRVSISLHKRNIVELEDIETVIKRPGEADVVTNHTDGAGTISRTLRDLVWAELVKNGARDGDGPAPDVLQIRLAGSKGIVVLDDRLAGSTIGIRKSQKKFEGYHDDAGATYTLSIAETFTRPGHLFLNRPLVSALEDLNIPASEFLKLQRSAIADINVDKSTYSGSRRLMSRYGLDASPLQILINNLDDLSAPSSLLTDDRFLRRCMDVLVARILGDIKTSARIPLPGCYHLVGVPDTDSLLAYDEVYACIRDQGGHQVWLEGKIAMTRSPTCSPGDVRIVTAVGRWKGIGRSPRYAVLTNCVVLPTLGTRSLCSQMGGGDLDGDTYQLITISSLIPKTPAQPRSHTAMGPMRLEKSGGIDDVSRTFARYLELDTVGLIATTHLRVADGALKGGHDPRCEALADLYSSAVDFVKTGNGVSRGEIEEAVGPGDKGMRPDFLRKGDEGKQAGRGFYQSKRALGQLYRDVPDIELSLDADGSDDDGEEEEEGTTDDFYVFYDSIHSQAVKLVQPTSGKMEPSSAFAEKAGRVLNAFTSEFLHVCEVNNFPRRPGQHLTEEEAFACTILDARIPRDKSGRKNAAASLQTAVIALVDAVDNATTVSSDLKDKLLLLWACWDESLLASPTVFGVKTFRWILVSMLVKTMHIITTSPVEEEAERVDSPAPSLNGSIASLRSNREDVLPPFTRQDNRIPFATATTRPPPNIPIPTPDTIPKVGKRSKGAKRAETNALAQFYAKALASGGGDAGGGGGGGGGGGRGGGEEYGGGGQSNESCGPMFIVQGGKQVAEKKADPWGDWN